MLDAAMKKQLGSLFADVNVNIELVYDASDNAKQIELKEMLDSVAACSPKITARPSENRSDVPRFEIHRQNKATGISFRGIPGGHEFSSLILAILNAADLGKMPDTGLKKQIQRLKGPVKIQTYISLTCENCPDVVQALNQISLINPSISHEMVDGGFVPEEIEAKKIQGVPSVTIGDKLIHSGRSSLNELITKLEHELGSEKASTSASTDYLGHFEIAVVGGGPAGVSSAIYSVRKGQKTALIAETFGGQVEQTKGIENMISMIYTEGPQLTADLDKHLRSYPVEILEHRKVINIETTEKGKTIFLSSGETLSCDSLIIATGAQWRKLNIPGEKDYTGRGVAYCPHCDGPYYKNKKVAVVGGGNSGVEAAIDLSGICKEVILLEFMDTLKADEILVKKLKTLKNVKVLTQARTAEITGDGEKVTALHYEDRETENINTIELDGVFVQIGLKPNSELVKDIVDCNPYGEIIIDEKGRTSEKGIYAAGDVTTVPFKQIVIAMGEGAKVALAVFDDKMKN